MVVVTVFPDPPSILVEDGAGAVGAAGAVKKDGSTVLVEVVIAVPPKVDDPISVVNTAEKDESVVVRAVLVDVVAEVVVVVSAVLPVEDGSVVAILSAEVGSSVVLVFVAPSVLPSIAL